MVSRFDWNIVNLKLTLYVKKISSLSALIRRIEINTTGIWNNNILEQLQVGPPKQLDFQGAETPISILAAINNAGTTWK